jgi:hypothetical protein
MKILIVVSRAKLLWPVSDPAAQAGKNFVTASLCCSILRFK